MKLFFTSVFAFFTLMSCSPDPDVEEATDPHFRSLDDGPANPDNPYDQLGALHNVLTENYLNAHVPAATATMLSQWDTLSRGNPTFGNLMPTSFSMPTASHIDYLDANRSTSLAAAIANSSLSTAGKASLSSFIANYQTLVAADADFNSVYDFAVSYETAVKNGSLTTNDKRIVLGTASLARHTYYLRKKKKPRPRDRDWDISWASFTGVVEGLDQSDAAAIAISSTAGIAANE